MLLVRHQGQSGNFPIRFASRAIPPCVPAFSLTPGMSGTASDEVKNESRFHFLSHCAESFYGEDDGANWRGVFYRVVSFPETPVHPSIIDAAAPSAHRRGTSSFPFPSAHRADLLLQVTLWRLWVACVMSLIMECSYCAVVARLCKRRVSRSRTAYSGGPLPQGCNLLDRQSRR